MGCRDIFSHWTGQLKWVCGVPVVSSVLHLLAAGEGTKVKAKVTANHRAPSKGPRFTKVLGEKKKKSTSLTISFNDGSHPDAWFIRFSAHAQRSSHWRTSWGSWWKRWCGCKAESHYCEGEILCPNDPFNQSRSKSKKTTQREREREIPAPPREPPQI